MNPATFHIPGPRSLFSPLFTPHPPPLLMTAALYTQQQQLNKKPYPNAATLRVAIIKLANKLHKLRTMTGKEGVD